MEIRLAKTAGFCIGVDGAVQLTGRLLDTGVFTRAAVLRPDKTYAVHLLDASYTKVGTL